MKGSPLLLALLLGILPGALQAEEGDAVTMLERFAAGQPGLSYRGVFTYERGGHRESLRITRGTVDGETYEHLEYLDGDRREIIRRGQRLTCIHPGTRLIRLYRGHLARRDGLEGIGRFYRLELDGEDRVAGRDAINLNVIPRDDNRHGFRLAVDSESGLMLRSELIDQRGRILERFQFVTVDMVPLQREWIVEARGEDDDLAAASVEFDDTAPEPAWRPDWLPPGFELALPISDDEDDVLTYSDGIAVFSVFIEPAEERDGAEGEARQGGTVAYTRGLNASDGRAFSVTVVGEIPRATARRIARSVVWSESPS